MKLHSSFFFSIMAAPGRIGKEIWQVHQVALKLHISVFFFFPNCCNPGCGEIAQFLFFLQNGCANQVALKLHISGFFSNCCFRRRPRAVHRTSAQFHTAMLRKSKVFTQNLQCPLLKSALLTKEVCKNSYRRGVSSLACPTMRCCMVLQAGLPPCEG